LQRHPTEVLARDMRRLSRILSILLALAALLASGCSTLEVSEGDSPEVILDKASEALERRLYSKAIDNYQRLESLYPYSRHSLQAQIMTAYAYYLKGDSLAAVRAAERFMRLHPRNPHVDYALYLKGIAHYANIGKPDRDPEPARKSIEALTQLLRQHPDSVYAQDAHRRLWVANRTLAEHDLHVARYYFDRAAYVATVNRCQRILTDHSGTRVTEPALGLMARAYARLGLAELAQSSFAILAHNFPESAELGPTRRALGQAEPAGQ
jgi:outer membrane protein assembly factor BamD